METATTRWPASVTTTTAAIPVGLAMVAEVVRATADRAVAVGLRRAIWTAGFPVVTGIQYPWPPEAREVTTAEVEEAPAAVDLGSAGTVAVFGVAAATTSGAMEERAAVAAPGAAAEMRVPTATTGALRSAYSRYPRHSA